MASDFFGGASATKPSDASVPQGLKAEGQWLAAKSYSWASQSSTTAAVQDWSSEPKGSPVKGS